MPFRRQNRSTVTRTTKPSLMSRLRGHSRNSHSRTVKTTTTTTVTPNHAHGHHSAGTTTTGRRSRWGRSNRTAGTTTGVHHHKRRVTFGDKISGAMLRLRGSLTGRPGVKAAGTRRMNGTDGRGSHRAY